MAGLVTVPPPGAPTIALRMQKATSLWFKGEILVFEQCERDDVRDGELCLIQEKLPRGQGSRYILAFVHVSAAAQGSLLQMEPISPPGPIYTPEDASTLAYACSSAEIISLSN